MMKPAGSGPPGPSTATILRRRSRRRRLRRLVLAVLLLAAIGIAIGFIATGRTIMPGVSKKIYPILYEQQIAAAAARYKVDPYLVAAVAETESGFNPSAVSPAGAVGVMQFMPDTADWVTSLVSWRGAHNPTLTDAADSIELGACYLAYLQTKFADLLQTLAAYNAGQGNVRQWVSAAGKRTFQLTDIQFPETRAFVEKVERYEELYRRIYPDVFASTAGATEAES